MFYAWNQILDDFYSVSSDSFLFTSIFMRSRPKIEVFELEIQKGKKKRKTKFDIKLFNTNVFVNFSRQRRRSSASNTRINW